MSLVAISANAIITDALQKLGVYAPNEILSDADARLGLAQLNDLIDDWLADSIYLYQTVDVVAGITAQTQFYTVGPTGMVPVARPVRVVVGRGVAKMTVGDAISNVDSVSALEWNSMYHQANNTDVPLLATPAVMYYEPQNPMGLLSVSPLPAVDGVLTFPALYGMPNFTDLTTRYALAPAQEQALKANLAIALNPYFGGSSVTPELAGLAFHNKRTLTFTNRLSRALSKREMQPPTPAGGPRG